MLKTKISAIASLLAIGAAITSLPSASAATSLDTVLVGSGFSRPVWIGSPKGDKNRLFVVEQQTGRIEIIKNGVILPTAFLTQTGIAIGNEQGLLSMAFDPNYASNGYFYVYYTATGGGTINIRRYQVTAGDPMTTDVADVTTATTLITIAHPTNTNHNGGLLKFGTDGLLYAGTGDGGSANDPPCNAQNKLSRLGKLLRLDVNNPPTYVPASNPFVGNTAFDPLIFGYGIRNPWRYDIDPATGDIYIGDVGQNAIEEINYLPAATAAGRNFGWRIMEGNNCTGLAACNGSLPCNDNGYTDPIHTYSHSGGACSVTGGVVYRGCAIPDLQGTYFFADYCSNQIWSTTVTGGVAGPIVNRTTELDPPGTPAITTITNFGRDECGEIYICEQGGEIWKIVPAAPAPAADLGNGKVGGNGLTPKWSACGLLDTGNFATLKVEDGPASRAAVLFVSLTQAATPTFGGTLVPGLPVLFTVPLVTDANGDINVGAAPGGSGPLSIYTQWLFDDPGATAGVGFSNALRLDFQP